MKNVKELVSTMGNLLKVLQKEVSEHLLSQFKHTYIHITDKWEQWAASSYYKDHMW